MSASANAIRKELVEIGKKLEVKGHVIGPGGNTSALCGDVVYMKASGICFEDAVPADYVGVSLKTGELVDGKKKPTCEKLVHLNCYKARPDIGAVVHTHPAFSVSYAWLNETLVPFTPDFVAIIGSPVPVVKYMLPAGAPIANKIGEAIKTHNAVFLENHGILCVGKNLKEAYYRCLLVEDSVKTVIGGKILGALKCFDEKQIKELDTSDFEKYRRALLKK